MRAKGLKLKKLRNEKQRLITLFSNSLILSNLRDTYKYICINYIQFSLIHLIFLLIKCFLSYENIYNNEEIIKLEIIQFSIFQYSVSEQIYYIPICIHNSIRSFLIRQTYIFKLKRFFN